MGKVRRGLFYIGKRITSSFCMSIVLWGLPLQGLHVTEGEEESKIGCDAEICSG